MFGGIFHGPVMVLGPGGAVHGPCSHRAHGGGGRLVGHTKEADLYHKGAWTSEHSEARG